MNKYCSKESINATNSYFSWVDKGIEECKHTIRGYEATKLEDLCVQKAMFDFCVKYADRFSPRDCREIEQKYHFPTGSIKAKFYDNLEKKKNEETKNDE